VLPAVVRATLGLSFLALATISLMWPIESLIVFGLSALAAISLLLSLGSATSGATALSP
jgi:hypothetical protein